MRRSSSPESRAADKWLFGLGILLWLVAVSTSAIFYIGAEAWIRDQEALLHELPPELASRPVFQAMPAFHSGLHLARSLLIMALPASFLAAWLIQRSGSRATGTVAAASGLVVVASTVAGLLWAWVVGTAPV